MKITIEPYSGGQYTSQETEAEHIESVISQFKRLLVAVGYHPDCVAEYFVDQNVWFEENITKEIEDDAV